MQLLMFVVFLLQLIIFITGENLEIVKIENGKIRGELREYFYAFEGIPYAEPPIGANRFQPPKPLKEIWTDVKEVVKYGEMCSQWNHDRNGIGEVFGDEDCLFLNVYVPSNVMASKEQVPVLFYIHGGAFMFGGANYYSPSEFMKKKVILVTINYRLGPFGFLSTGDNVLPGNLGMKDQVMALKWVNKNIQNFNGNRNEITIMGFSAGGASVHSHYMSPLSRGLFKNGVSFSGCALNPWVIAENAEEKTHQLAAYLNCDHKNHQKLLECLMKKPAKEISSTVKLFQPFLYNPFTPFGIVVEGNKKGAFLTDFPSNLLREGKILKRPWLTTATKDEGLYPAAEFYRKERLLKIDLEWNQIMPFVLHYNETFSDAKQRDAISQRIRKEYLENDKKCFRVSEKYFFGLRDVISDRMYNYGIWKALQLQHKYMDTYFYSFNYKSVRGLAEFLSQTNENLGISHGEDVFLILPQNFRDDAPMTGEEFLMSSNLIDMILNFSQNETFSFADINLEKIQKNTLKYLEISDPQNGKIREFKNFGNEEFWDKTIKFDKEN